MLPASGHTRQIAGFAQHVQSGSWEDACLFQANVGRSLSLGDFALVNVARTILPVGTTAEQSFYLAMARAVIAHQQDVLSLAPDPEDVVFCCSSADSEGGLVWSALPNAEPGASPNVGPTKPFPNSGVAEGPPSVS